MIPTTRLRNHLRDLATTTAALNDYVLSGALSPRHSQPESLEALRARLWAVRCALERADLEALMLLPLAVAEEEAARARLAATAEFPNVVPLRREAA